MSSHSATVNLAMLEDIIGVESAYHSLIEVARKNPTRGRVHFGTRGRSSALLGTAVPGCAEMGATAGFDWPPLFRADVRIAHGDVLRSAQPSCGEVRIIVVDAWSIGTKHGSGTGRPCMIQAFAGDSHSRLSFSRYKNVFPHRWPTAPHSRPLPQAWVGSSSLPILSPFSSSSPHPPICRPSLTTSR